eukprot:2225183-Rhodomonas_salina.4
MQHASTFPQQSKTALLYLTITTPSITAPTFNAAARLYFGLESGLPHLTCKGSVWILLLDSSSNVICVGFSTRLLLICPGDTRSTWASIKTSVAW